MSDTGFWRDSMQARKSFSSKSALPYQPVPISPTRFRLSASCAAYAGTRVIASAAAPCLMKSRRFMGLLLEDDVVDDDHPLPVQYALVTERGDVDGRDRLEDVLPTHAHADP